MSPGQLLGILWRRWWIIVLTFCSTLAAATMALWLLPARFDAVATASIDAGQPDPVTGQTVGASALRLVQGNMIALAESQRVAVEVVRRLRLTADPAMLAQYRASDAVGRVDAEEWVATLLLKNVEAKFALSSNVLTITYKSSSANQAALVANAFMSAFIDAAVERKVSSAQQTAQWFEPQMDALRKNLADARARLAQFQRETNMLAPEQGAVDTENSRLVSVTSQLSELKNQLLAIESQMHATAASGAGADAQVTDSPLLANLRSTLASNVAEVSKLRNEVGANNPKLLTLIAAQKSLQEQIAAEIAQIRETMGTRAKALRDQIQYLEKARAEEIRKLIAVQAQREQLGSLQRDVEFHQEQVNGAAKAAAAARLQSQLSFSNIAKLDDATPPVTPAFPKTIQIMAAGIGSGLSLGLILALIAEALDRRVRVVRDLEFAAEAPVLGVLLPNRVPRSGRIRAASALLPSARRRRAPGLPDARGHGPQMPAAE